ncbi:hypothetical protein HUG17_5078 [Dermatophagoides farinae]|uniref:Uncharacterized protein n=1 Tax=Dermatophagoides farinae TaxID=6954 RepID=A0A9D4P111_DERFA|nr:hypothetical protein HUG17_5078 [Dermatophagoides farinae]
MLLITEKRQSQKIDHHHHHHEKNIKRKDEIQPLIKLKEKSLSLTIERKPKDTTKFIHKDKENDGMNKIKSDSFVTLNSSALVSGAGSILSYYSTSKYESRISDNPMSNFEQTPESGLFSDVSSFIYNDSIDSNETSSSIRHDDHHESSTAHLFSTLNKSDNEHEKRELMIKKTLAPDLIKYKRPLGLKDEQENNPIIKRPAPVLRKTLATIYKHSQSYDDSIRMCKKICPYKKKEQSEKSFSMKLNLN